LKEGSIWENEAIKAFYESLPDLKILFPPGHFDDQRKGKSLEEKPKDKEKDKKEEKEKEETKEQENPDEQGANEAKEDTEPKEKEISDADFEKMEQDLDTDVGDEKPLIEEEYHFITIIFFCLFPRLSSS